MRKNLLFCLLCILCTVNMYAESWTDGNGVTWSFSITTIDGTTGASLNGMVGNTKDVVIPEVVYSSETPYPVIYMDYNTNLFCLRTDIETIKLPSSLMGMYSNYYGSSTFPASTGVSYYCGVFTHCENLKTVDVNGCHLAIGGRAFSDCTSLQSISNLTNCTSIGSNAFYNCTSLQSIGELSNCTSIGREAFSYCTSLQSIGDLSNCTSIGGSAFYNCTSLQSIEDLSNCTSIGSSAFYHCTSLQSIGDLTNCTSIGGSAFSGCSSLPKIIINQNTPPSLGSSPFATYHSFIVPRESVDAYISAWGTDYVPRLIPLEATTDYEITPVASDNSSSIQDLITEECLQNVISLKLVEKDGVTPTINAYDLFVMRNKMPNLHYLDLTDARIVETKNGYPYYGTYSTEDDVLGDYAFFQQEKLMEVKLPKVIKRIGVYAFCHCVSIKEFVCPSSLISIGSDAFQDCIHLEEFQFSSSLEEIGIMRFYLVQALHPSYCHPC